MIKITKYILIVCTAFVLAFSANAQSTSAEIANSVSVSLEMQAQIQEALNQRMETNSQASYRTLTATYVGAFQTDDGPNWTTNPAALSGVEAAAVIFGGSPSDYAISTNPSTTDPSTITHTAWATTWGVAGCQEVAEDYSLDLGAPGYNDPGGNNTATSAYVDDNCTTGALNYVWLVNTSLPSFITTWQTTAASETITIPTNGSGYNYSVDWGDGNTDTGVIANAVHTYVTPGLYTVTIDGAFPRIYFNNSGGDRLKIKSIEHWGTNSWTSMNMAFAGCTNLVSNATDVPDLSLVNDMFGMFAFARTFNGDAGFGNWNVSNVTNMYGMFAGASVFNYPIGSWNVSNVTNMQNMFNGATVFNQNIGAWNVGNVTNMKEMFRTAYEFNKSLDSWNVGNVTDMSGMFGYARKFNGPIGNWNVGNVTNMYGMFGGASVFNQDISSWDVGNVTNMESMFHGATKFRQDLGTWNVSNVTNMKNMFYTALRFNGAIGNWNVGNVTNMNSMFFHSGDFDQDLGAWNVSNVTNMTNMFKGATLSTTNYDALLSGWNSLPLKSNVKFHGGNSKYCSAVADRQNMISSFNWTITDGGSDCAPPLRMMGGEDSNSALAAITAYPNPMGEQLNLANPENLQLDNVSIYDLAGRLIKMVDLRGVSSEMTLDVSDLSKATYMVVINGEAGRISKLMVKR